MPWSGPLQSQQHLVDDCGSFDIPGNLAEAELKLKKALTKIEEITDTAYASTLACSGTLNGMRIRGKLIISFIPSMEQEPANTASRRDETR